MPDLRWGLALALCLIQRAVSSNLGPNEHKIHNIVLYPDKHSWCKTTEIKQIVAHPGCSSVEIDNNVCVGGCFSYSIPKTMPSAPGEEITPYCDTCQPTNYTWKEVKLTCQPDSEEEETPAVEMVKKVQVITNCTCATCQYQTAPQDQHKHIGENTPDVPELLSFIKTHKKDQLKVVPEDEEEEGEDEVAEDSSEDEKLQEGSHIVTVHPPENEVSDLENTIEDDGEKQKEDRRQESTEEESGVNKLEIVRVNHGSHLVAGPHHSLVMKPDVLPQLHHEEMHHKKNEEEEEPSLLQNQFKIHDNEEYLDQIAVESRKQFDDKPLEVYTLPHLIYSAKLNDTPQLEARQDKPNLEHTREEGKVQEEKVHRHHHHHHHIADDTEVSIGEEERKVVKVVEVAPHHLSPAVEGAELSYIVKDSPPKSN